MSPFNFKHPGPIKLTIISETDRVKFTTVYKKVWPQSADMQVIEPKILDEIQYPNPKYNLADIGLKFLVAIDDEENLIFTTHEVIDPIFDKIDKLVYGYSSNNTDAQRAELKRQLIQLVENDRKENQK